MSRTVCAVCGSKTTNSQTSNDCDECKKVFCNCMIALCFSENSKTGFTTDSMRIINPEWKMNLRQQSSIHGETQIEYQQMRETQNPEL